MMCTPLFRIIAAYPYLGKPIIKSTRKVDANCALKGLAFMSPLSVVFVSYYSKISLLRPYTMWPP